MSLIRSRGTKPERAMARLLRHACIRYRTHANLPGTPDFVLAAKIAIFVDGDFFHGRDMASLAPKLNELWLNKITNNRRRDRRVSASLRRMHWSVIRVWESDLKRRPDACLARIRCIIRRRT